MAQHGGSLSWIEAHYPHAPRPLIDLSTGINPYACALPDIKPEWLYRLPDSAEMAAAHDAAAKYYGAKHIALASGMQPLMTALACLRLKDHGPSGVAVLSPSYSEHANVWQAAGHRVHFIPSFEKLMGDVVIITNPNNPDGRQFTPEQLLQLAKRVELLIVDESFGDLSHELSMAALCAKEQHIIVLKSCGKFFGVAGLRISAAIASRKIITWLDTMLGPWPISTIACNLLPDMLNKGLSEYMRKRLAQESASWRNLLSKPFTIVGHTDLFTLVETEHADQWHGYLASQGVLTRKFDYNARWLRFGLPDIAHRQRIETILQSL